MSNINTETQIPFGCLRDLTPASLKKARDDQGLEVKRITKALIDAGRGAEKPDDVCKKTDPLSVSYKKACDSYYALTKEVERRMKWSGTLRRTMKPNPKG